MTTPNAEPVAAPGSAKPASLWEDFIDIFYAPTSVYERRLNSSPWPAIIIVTILITVVTVLTFGRTEPIQETEIRHAMTALMAKTPQLTQDIADKQVSMQLIGKKWGVVAFPIGALVGSLFIWLVARIVGMKETYGGALLAIAYSSIIAVAQLIVVGAQALVMDVTNLTSMDQLSLSGARFLDKATASPVLYAVLKNVDLFGIWGLVVLSIGVRVTSKGSKNSAIMFGVVWWVITTLILVLVAMRSAA